MSQLHTAFLFPAKCLPLSLFDGQSWGCLQGNEVANFPTIIHTYKLLPDYHVIHRAILRVEEHNWHVLSGVLKVLEKKHQ